MKNIDISGARLQAGDQKRSRVMEGSDVHRALVRMAHEIVERDGDSQILLAGIGAQGALIAARLCQALTDSGFAGANFGTLDVTLYRDDISQRPLRAIGTTDITDITDKVVVIVDDVLYTGRTARAALDALIAIGRPKSIRLAVLCDRGHRELPIRADYVGKNLPTSHSETVVVSLNSTSSDDWVEIHG